MDAQTRQYYDELTARQSKLRWSCLPQWEANHYVLLGHNDGVSYNYTELTYGRNQVTRIYGDWYRCLAYMEFGYGNKSNNDRKRHGLKPLRKRRKKALN